MGGWIDGGKRDGWIERHHKLCIPSNSITTVLTHSLIHSLMGHSSILAPQSSSGQERAGGLH